MGWATSLANSLGVAEEGLRLILGQISGSYLFIKILGCWDPRCKHEYLDIIKENDEKCLN